MDFIWPVSLWEKCWSFFGLYFHALRLNKEIFLVNLCRKSPRSGRIRENIDQKKSWDFFQKPNEIPFYILNRLYWNIWNESIFVNDTDRKILQNFAKYSWNYLCWITDKLDFFLKDHFIDGLSHVFRCSSELETVPSQWANTYAKSTIKKTRAIPVVVVLVTLLLILGSKMLKCYFIQSPQV